ncbi:MAG: DUF3791 domain-containing protein [Bacteroidales bacterium]|nr:DUF3791 domain-containing protein [Candidatus Colimorpha merdihippi]
MSREDHNTVGYVVSLVSEFANRYGIKPRQAYAYLSRFKGLDHLYNHYNVLHTYSFDETVDVVSEVCRHNGGKLQ